MLRIRSKEADSKYQYYQYDPSLGGAAATVVVFAILTMVHVWKLIRFRTYFFMAFTIGGIFECIGYAGRIWSHYDDNSLGAFVIEAILILVAPALYAASIYMTLGRLIRALHAEHLSFIRVQWLTKIFVAGDVVAFGLQGAGGGMQAGGTAKAFKRGERIIIAGLFVQIVVFSVFVIALSTIHHRVARSPTCATGSIPWRRHLYALYASSCLILVRSIFRVVEYIQGNNGYLISHEIFLFVFDAVLMAAVMAIFAIWYVGRLHKYEDAEWAARRASAEPGEVHHHASRPKM